MFIMFMRQNGYVSERMAAELQRMLESDEEDEEDDAEESVFNTITIQMG